MNLTANEKNAAAARQRRYVLLLAVMLVLLFIIIVLSFWVGYYPLTPVQVLNAFLSKFGFKGDILPQAVTIFWNIRLPRILSALFIGASLSVAGATYQGMFRNPLVSPDILGVSSGASLGAAFAILNGASNWMIQLSAFAGGVAAVAASYLISRKSAHSQTLSLVLTGTMIMSLCNAGVTMIKYVADPNDVLQQITFWLMGSLTKTTTKSFCWSVLPMIIGLSLIFIFRWQINLLTLDEEEAKSLGINVRKYRLIFIVASTLLSAAAVCLGGLIGWVGLMIPHLARALVGVDYRRLIPASTILGGGYLIFPVPFCPWNFHLALSQVSWAPPSLSILSSNERSARNYMLLEIENVFGGYGNGDILKGISCSADYGDVLCLLGPNGCGKTTLFRMILDSLPVSNGKIKIAGKNISDFTTKTLANMIAYIPQYHSPVFAYTVLDMVIMGRASHFSAFETPREPDQEAAFAALEKVNALPLANRKYTSLSGGQRQLVLIARAICQSAKIFIMDEPAANLDYANHQLLMEVISGLANQGYCIIMSTHSPEHPFSVGNKVLLMKSGKVMGFGSPKEIITSETLQSVYDIEMDVITTHDRYGRERTICLPVNSSAKTF